MNRLELANLKAGNILHTPGVDIYCTVKEVFPLRGILVEVDVTLEHIFVDSDEVLDDLEVFV